jgi:hypothetical protein
MAISSTQYFLVREMFQHGLLPRHPAILEIGEANWYDLAPMTMLEDIQKYVSDPVRRDALCERLRDIVEKKREHYLFAIAKIFYELFFEPSEMQAVDYQGTATALRLDLNGPIALNRRFDVVINHGTAEHIFNVAQVFKTVHDYTVPGGLMMHESPFTGWIEHGFYNLQPTLYFDLAEVNQYMLHGMFVQDLTARTVLQIRAREDLYELVKANDLPENSMLFTVFRKPAVDVAFQIPIQGYYRGSLPSDGITAWRELR